MFNHTNTTSNINYDYDIFCELECNFLSLILNTVEKIDFLDNNFFRNLIKKIQDKKDDIDLKEYIILKKLLDDDIFLDELFKESNKYFREFIEDIKLLKGSQINIEEIRLKLIDYLITSLIKNLIKKYNGNIQIILNQCKTTQDILLFENSNIVIKFNHIDNEFSKDENTEKKNDDLTNNLFKESNSGVIVIKTKNHKDEGHKLITYEKINIEYLKYGFIIITNSEGEINLLNEKGEFFLDKKNDKPKVFNNPQFNFLSKGIILDKNENFETFYIIKNQFCIEKFNLNNPDYEYINHGYIIDRGEKSDILYLLSEKGTIERISKNLNNFKVKEFTENRKLVCSYDLGKGRDKIIIFEDGNIIFNNSKLKIMF